MNPAKKTHSHVHRRDTESRAPSARPSTLGAPSFADLWLAADPEGLLAVPSAQQVRRRDTESRAPSARPSTSRSPSYVEVWLSAAPQGHAVPSAQQAPALTGDQPGVPVHSEPSVRTLPRTHTQKVKVGIVQKRAEGLTKVPKKLRNSFKDFFFSATGLLKITKTCLITAAVFCFIIGHAHEMFILITIQETCISLFFLISYLVTLQHLLTCLHWPLLDLINSILSTIFLLIVGIMTIQEKGRRQLFYVGAILSLTVAILCFIDGLVVIKKMTKGNKKEGQGTESKHSKRKVVLSSGQ